MPKVRSPYDDPRHVPDLDYRIVDPGQEVAVTPEQLPRFLAAGWIPVDTPARRGTDTQKQEG